MEAEIRDRRSPRHGVAADRHRIGRCVAAAVALLAASVTIGVRSQDAPRQQAPPQDVPFAPVPAVPDPPAVPPVPVPGFQPMPGRGDISGSGRPTLFATDRVAARRLKLAESRLSNGTYEEAVDLLQTILDSEEDAAAPAETETQVFRSLKRQAIDLLSQLPPEGRRIYELKYGVAARGQLEDALKQGNWDGVEAVSRRYFHTPAGREATYRLAVWADDRGESLEAALLFQRLVDDGLSPFEPRLSLRTSAAWSKAGMDDLGLQAADRYLKLVKDKQGVLPNGVEEPKSPEQLVAWLKKTAGAGESSSDPTWPTFGGSADRLADVAPVSIAEGAVWSHRLHEPTQWDSAREAARVSRIAMGLDLLTKSARAHGDLTQPAFHPVVARNAAIFRTLRNIQAVDLASGSLLWQTEPPHDQYFDNAVKELGIFIPFSQEDISGLSFGDAVEQFAWENLTSGTLSTDGRFVYGVEGTGRAETTRIAVQGIRRPNAVGEDDYNTLVAYELAAEGRIAWTAGGPGGNGPSSGFFFLGPPLPLGGRLYAIAEQAGSIALLAIDPLADPEDRIVWSQTLVETDENLIEKPHRRSSGLSPTFADGVLVCPTGAGAVVGVDLARRVLLWGYEYADSRGLGFDPNTGMILGNVGFSTNNRPRWLDAVPHIANGAVFLTPMDSEEVHCLDLRTGNVRWKQPRETLLYLATVHDGKAVFAGRTSLRALDITTGETVWEQPLDVMPAGRGVRSGDLYHMPLMSGEIATIHLRNHQELVRSPLGSGLSPGNLIAVRGRLLSLSADAIVGFEPTAQSNPVPQDAAAAMSEAAADELALRGTQALHRGEVEQGLSLLKQAATTGGSAKAKHSYAHALLGGLRADFAKYRKYEQDLLKIVDEPGQKAELSRLLADGFEAANEMPAAFEALLRLAESDVARPGYTDAGGDRLVRRDRLDRSRIRRMLAVASESDRSAMEAQAHKIVQQAVEAQDSVWLERLVAMLGPTDAGLSALAALESLYAHVGAVKELERVRMQLGKAGTDQHQPTFAFAEEFNVAWRADYIPEEIKSVPKDSAAAHSVNISIIGPVPASHAGWQFALADNIQSLVARDRIGREQWRLPLGSAGAGLGPDPFGSRPANAGRAHVRFSGHLMAVAVGTRVLMLDLLSEADPPPVLWAADLSERTYSVVIINRRVMNEAADGPMGFAGSRLFLYEGGGALNAVDPLTGDLLWRKIGIPDNCELSGDDEFVTVQLPAGGDVLVLDVDDGKVVAQRALPAMFERLGWFGTKIVTVRPVQQEVEVASEDVARGTHHWSVRFSENALVAPVGSDEIAVLEPAVGHLQLIKCADGSVTLEGKIDPDPAIVGLAVTRHFGKIVLFTKRNEPPGRIHVENDRTRSPVDGLTYAFDEHGNRIWSAAIRYQYVDLHQPSGLPVLTLTASRFSLQEQRTRTYHTAVLDVRNGQTLIEQRRLSEFQPIAINADPDARSISIDCRGAAFLLTPSDKPLPPPKADGLAELKTAASTASLR